MEYSVENWEAIASAHIAEWTRRSKTPTVAKLGPGCFVWDSYEDGIRGSGMFYKRDMVTKNFGEEMGRDLQQMIDDADHTGQVVVALRIGDKAVGLRLHKSYEKSAVTAEPPIIH